ncbi:hypothetical protein [Pseudoduganella lutea]|uniref:HEPN domain-containing protein n=1 Tax=Pseudoduganella lutea TaxID=321985 RepID=A0A4P6KZD1_9BURK|nr:hypothetical protein [Pseudoduganella lutea]QBE64274.1 hypothetical protein EWM63_15825 [Pseudoduganella lutea]
MAKQTKTVDGSKYSPWQLLEAANAYYALSNVLTSELADTMAMAESIKPDLGDAAASATNRVLAVELYFKALFVGAELPVPLTHDLVTLFDTLPPDIREPIEQNYANVCADADPNLPWEVALYFQLGKAPKKMIVPKTNPSDGALKAFLERNRGGFVLTRYLFEQGTHDNVSHYRYEYRRLGILCRILCGMLEMWLQNPLPGYKRGFNF